MKSMAKNWLKAVLILSLMGGFASTAHAEKSVDLYGAAEFLFPTELQDLQFTTMYDAINKKALLGGEVSVLRRKNLEATVGLATEADVWDGSQKGVLYGGLRHESEEKFFQFGLFAGRDFTHNLWRAGVKIGKSFGVY